MSEWWPNRGQNRAVEKPTLCSKCARWPAQISCCQDYNLYASIYERSYILYIPNMYIYTVFWCSYRIAKAELNMGQEVRGTAFTSVRDDAGCPGSVLPALRPSHACSDVPRRRSARHAVEAPMQMTCWCDRQGMRNRMTPIDHPTGGFL